MVKSRPAKSSDTSDEIIEVAEMLFASDHFDSVSLRRIGELAGCANKSVVQYHFGDREGLIRAIFERRLDTIDRQRASLLAERQTGGNHPSARQLLEIILRPILEFRNSKGKRSYSGFLRKHAVLRRQDSKVLPEGLAPVTTYILQLLRAHYPDLDEARFGTRMQACSVVWLDVIPGLDSDVSDEDEIDTLNELLNLSEAVLSASQS